MRRNMSYSSPLFQSKAHSDRKRRISMIWLAGELAYQALFHTLRYLRKLRHWYCHSYRSMSFAMISLGVVPASPMRQSGVYCRCWCEQKRYSFSLPVAGSKPFGSFHGGTNAGSLITDWPEMLVPTFE